MGHREPHRLSGHPAPVVHPGGLGRRHRVPRRRARDESRLGARAVARARGAHRGELARLERVRARGHARPEGQLHRRLHHREHRPDGRAHGRLDHRRARDDADRPRVPASARRCTGHHDRDRRRDGRRQRAVRGLAQGRPRAGHRDEPACITLERARVQGDRLPDCEDRCAPRRRVHARRAAQRHHVSAQRGRRSELPRADARRDERGLRTDDRLRRREVASLRVREIPGRRRDARPADEERR